MTRLDIDPRFAAAHYQDGRDLRGAQPSVHSVAGDLHPSCTVRTGDEGWKLMPTEATDAMMRAGQAYHAKFQFARPLPALWRWSELWQAMTAAAPAAQLGDVSVPAETLSGAQKQDHPECCSPPAAVPAYQPMTDEEVDRALSVVVPGGSQARDWFLPHETERGLANVRNVVRLMVSAVLARVAAAPAAAPVAQDARASRLLRALLREAIEYLIDAHPSGDSEFIRTCRAALSAAPAAVQPVAQQQPPQCACQQCGKTVSWSACRDADEASLCVNRAVAQQQPSVHSGVGVGLPSQAVRTGGEGADQ